jgi:hypothetical protein
MVSIVWMTLLRSCNAAGFALMVIPSFLCPHPIFDHCSAITELPDRCCGCRISDCVSAFSGFSSLSSFPACFCVLVDMHFAAGRSVRAIFPCTFNALQEDIA